MSAEVDAAILMKVLVPVFDDLMNDTLTVKVYRAPGMDQAITDKGVDLSGVEKNYSESYYLTLEVALLNDKAA